MNRRLAQLAVVVFGILVLSGAVLAHRSIWARSSLDRERRDLDVLLGVLRAKEIRPPSQTPTREYIALLQRIKRSIEDARRDAATASSGAASETYPITFDAHVRWTLTADDIHVVAEESAKGAIVPKDPDDHIGRTWLLPVAILGRLLVKEGSNLSESEDAGERELGAECLGLVSRISRDLRNESLIFHVVVRDVEMRLYSALVDGREDRAGVNERWRSELLERLCDPRNVYAGTERQMVDLLSLWKEVIEDSDALQESQSRVVALSKELRDVAEEVQKAKQASPDTNIRSMQAHLRHIQSIKGMDHVRLSLFRILNEMVTDLEVVSKRMKACSQDGALPANHPAH